MLIQKYVGNQRRPILNR